MKDKKGQIWVETVLYTMIGLALIGLVLAIAMPKINETKDRIVVEQTLESLMRFEERINTVLDTAGGNRRGITSLTMKRGELYINASNDKIIFVVGDLKKPYSEPGALIDYSNRISLVTEEGLKTSTTTITLDYVGIANLTYQGQDIDKKFSATATPYSFYVENLGRSDPSDFNDLFVIDIGESS